MEFKAKEYDEKFETVEEFKTLISHGGEVEFTFENKNYSITRLEKDRIHFMEAYNYESEKYFDSVEGLLDHEINGKKLRDIVTIIQPFFRTF